MSDQVEPFTTPPAPAETATSASIRASSRRRPFRFWALLALVIAFFLTGVVLVGYYVWLTRAASPASVEGLNPWEELQPQQILPGVAVMSLAGFPPQRAYREAMAQDAVETATAEAITSTSLPEAERLGWLIVLARRQALAGDVIQGAHLYQLAYDLALLKPNLGARAQADVLIQAAQGWLALDYEKDARRALVQAALLAQKGAGLSDPVRRQLLDRIAAAYEQMNDVDAARAARAMPVERSAPMSAQTPDPLAILLAKDPPPYPDRVQRALDRREAQALAYVQSWADRGGQVAAGDRLALENALLDEDLLRSIYYTDQIGDATLDIGVRGLLAWDRIRWLIIKRRVAEGLYGDVISPRWAETSDAIRQEAYAAFVGFRDPLLLFIDSLPEEQRQPATYNLARNALMWARIGLYPDANQVDLANSLNEALAAWTNARGLQVQAVVEDDRVRFELIDLGQAPVAP